MNLLYLVSLHVLVVNYSSGITSLYSKRIILPLPVLKTLGIIGKMDRYNGELGNERNNSINLISTNSLFFFNDIRDEKIKIKDKK